ncbi:GNAT family N-acetyltransferase [Aquibium oceanicum]|uniref:BioF2-like acetyltransferase domain-containing protein n=1 Tax=Aquibium oceanicum TaxID=1670800 RepID=A0A1L3SQY0_9HYPH|nr:GNAT family N-acetyltransferase [Aquibium oceanicum]APH71837.1 hypothetical protein BSQ44_10990 [Aquibium oceanicum]
MVDARASADLHFAPDGRTLDGTGSKAAAGFSVRCLTNEAAIFAYSEFCARALFAPPQSPRWVESWARHCNPDVVVLSWESDAGGMAIPLEIVREGAFRIARFPGGSHANGNFPAVLGKSEFDLAGGKALSAALKAARPDVDLLLLERQVKSFEGAANPLATLASWESPNPALAVDLAGGFDAVLERASAKRKRKKHRSQIRKFEAAGGYKRIRATSRAETDALLEAFFAMKAARLAANGIQDVFGDRTVQEFFRDLFGAASEADAKPEFFLHGLEIGGKLRAITGCSLTPSSVICEFGSIAEDELASTSPGEFLFFENIREACEDDIAFYDFSVGDETYKRLWCDVETRHFDVAIPIGARGRLAIGLRQATNTAKRLIKSNEFAWTFVKRLRRAAAGKGKAA